MAQDIPALVERMRNGDVVARNKLIEAHVHLAFSLANRFDDDEALSEALLDLVTAVDSFKSMDLDPGGLSAYVKQAVYRASFRHLRGSGQKKDQRPESIEQITLSYELKDHKLRSLHENDAFEVRELIESLCEDEVERLIIEFKSRNMTNVEVQNSLSVRLSRATLSRMLQRLATRFGMQEKLLGQHKRKLG